MEDVDRVAVVWVETQIAALNREIEAIQQSIAELEQERQRHQLAMGSAEARKKLLTYAVESYKDAFHGRDRHPPGD